jgi:hypothetical protein
MKLFDKMKVLFLLLIFVSAFCLSLEAKFDSTEFEESEALNLLMKSDRARSKASRTITLPPTGKEGNKTYALPNLVAQTSILFLLKYS